jgi:hypothetical protein
MTTLEDDVQAVRAHTKDEVVDRQVGNIIHEMGCTINMDSKFH